MQFCCGNAISLSLSFRERVNDRLAANAGNVITQTRERNGRMIVRLRIAQQRGSRDEFSFFLSCLTATPPCGTRYHTSSSLFCSPITVFRFSWESFQKIASSSSRWRARAECHLTYNGWARNVEREVTRSARGGTGRSALYSRFSFESRILGATPFIDRHDRAILTRADDVYTSAMYSRKCSRHWVDRKFLISLGPIEMLYHRDQSSV